MSLTFSTLLYVLYTECRTNADITTYQSIKEYIINHAYQQRACALAQSGECQNRILLDAYCSFGDLFPKLSPYYKHRTHTNTIIEARGILDKTINYLSKCSFGYIKNANSKPLSMHLITNSNNFNDSREQQ